MWRDWTFVDDITDGVAAALDRPLGYEVINLGRGEPVQLRDFITCLEELAGQKANLIAQPMLAADVPYTFADISKARRLLGFEPKTSYQDGLARFWSWYLAQFP